MKDLTDPTNVDSVPAMLTPGEFVLNKEASQMFAKQIEAMNKAGLQQREAENRNVGGAIPRNMGGAIYRNKGGGVFDNWDGYASTIGGIESGNKYDITGGANDHYQGRFQLGEAAKKDAAKRLGVDVPSREDFVANPELQDKFFRAYTEGNHESLLKKNKKYAAMSPQEQQQALGYAHNQGAGGASKWLDTGEAGSDAFGTSGTKYSEALKASQGTGSRGSEVAAGVPPVQEAPPSFTADLKGSAIEAGSQYLQGEALKALGLGGEQPQQRAPVQHQQLAQLGGGVRNIPVGGIQRNHGGPIPQDNDTIVNGQFMSSHVPEIQGLNIGGWLSSLFAPKEGFNQRGNPELDANEVQRQVEAQQSAGVSPAGQFSVPQQLGAPAMPGGVGQIPVGGEGQAPYGQPPAQPVPDYYNSDQPPVITTTAAPGSDQALMDLSSENVEAAQSAQAEIPRGAAGRGAVPDDAAEQAGRAANDIQILTNELNSLPPSHPQRARLQSDIDSMTSELRVWNERGVGNELDIPELSGTPPLFQQEIEAIAQTANHMGESPRINAEQASIENQRANFTRQLETVSPDEIPQIQSEINMLDDREQELEVQTRVQQLQSVEGLSEEERSNAIAAVQEKSPVKTVGGLGAPSEADSAPVKLTAPAEKKAVVETATTTEDQAASEVAVTEAGGADAVIAAGDAAGKADPKVISSAKGTIKEAFGDLFDGKELVRAAVMYAGGVATGLSPQQALAFAGRGYIGRLDAKEASHTATVKKLTTDAKYTAGSIAAYKESKDQRHLIPIEDAATLKELGNQKEFYGPNGTRIQAREVEDKAGNKHWLDGKGRPVNLNTTHQDPSRAKGTPEYRKRVNDSTKVLSGTFKELQDRFGKFEGQDGAPDSFATDLTPGKVGANTAKWAIENGVEPEDVAQILDNAYAAARLDSKDGKRVKNIEAYLNAEYVQAQVGDPTLFQDKKGDTISGEKVSNLMSRLAAASGLQGSSVTQSTAILQKARPLWAALDSGVREEWNNKAIAGNNGFVLWMENELSSGL